MHVLLSGKKVRIDPACSIGKGGEADVYEVGGGVALKLFKPPDHPDFEGDAFAQQGARERLDEHQRKLPAFPSGLPDRVVVPQALALDASGRIVGYSMRLVPGAEVLLRYGDRPFRQGIPAERVFDVFRDLHATVAALHHRGVVIGDFNDLNVLVAGTQAHLIDADSMQFGSFPCRVFTERFVDPRLCDPKADRLLLVHPHTRESDWYAFSAMLMRSLLFVEPYGGVYRPGSPRSRMAPPARPLHRITVFHPDVRYPKPAERWDVLPDDLLQHFHAVFVKDQRHDFPTALLDAARWTRCSGCGHEHARSLCPYCAGAPPAAVREVTRVRGEVTARRIFATRGRILGEAFQTGRLCWLYQDGDVVRREDGAVAFAGQADARLRLRIRGPHTLVGRDQRVFALGPGAAGAPLTVDTAGGQPMFDTNERHLYRVQDGRLVRDGAWGPERIGDVLAGQTTIWVGPGFGFGLYHAGQLQVAFVFDAERGGLRDGVALPRLAGQLTAVRCVFGADRCWLLSASAENGRAVHRATLILRDGTVAASTAAAAGDGSWLGHLGAGCAAGPALLVPTDNGIVRVEAQGSSLAKTREFPDTEPFVDAASRLIAGDGLYVVGEQEILRLSLSRAE